MFGLRFEGHPNLRRLLTHEAFRGHPLRKDYDPARRASSVPFTREKDKITCGVLYKTDVPSLTDQLDDMKERAMPADGAPSTKEMLSAFYPKF